ncbi:MAG: DEAD/DEAH box helicase [Solirubrobacteraceae bacterium]
MSVRASHAQAATGLSPSFAPALNDPSERARRGGLRAPLGLYGPLLERLKASDSVCDERSALVDEALGVWARPGFETFMCLPRLRFEPFPYQLEAATRVLRHMQGRAVLADEVGLGKTIEAGLVLSELRLRGLAARVLVLAPAGLVGQWCEELERKFALPCVVAGAGFEVGTAPSEAAAPGAPRPIVVASLAAARRDPLAATLTASTWDLVIADEAHRLKNPRTASARLARSLRTRYLLLLSATPIENRLADIFQLVSLVRPGSLGSASDFRARHGRGDGREPRNVASLQLALREVMVRHRRSEITVMLPRRLAETVRVSPGAQEAGLYRAISDRVREQAHGATPARALALRSAQQLAGSSPWACAPSLAKLGWQELAQRSAEAPGMAKAAALLELVERHLARGEKVVVFTAFRRTLDRLAVLLAEHGLPTVVYHGSLSRTQKDAAIAGFAADVPILLSTEAAGEGRNLQFCHAMINFDLPWNPMQIEQRLGRIHRIGQQHDVLLTNLVTRGTLEERLLEVLQVKINLFELVVGELDMILGRVHDDLDFASLVFGEYVASRDDADFTSRLEVVGDELVRARLDYLETRHRIDGLVAG